MKLSVAWILDHICEMAGIGDVSSDIADMIVSRLGNATAEIDGIDKLTLNPDRWVLVQCKHIHADSIVVWDAEHGREHALPYRPDAHVERWYLVCPGANNVYRWSQLYDIEGAHEGMLPAMQVAVDEQDGSWKKFLEREDIRLTIDNKTITHRPDLWSHRGFAREVAALCGWHMRPLQELLHACDIQEQPEKIIHTVSVLRFATASLQVEAAAPSMPWMAFRLARVDSRPRNRIVDATNYVLFDCGQPLHAFDADQVTGGKLYARQAYPHERLALLDGKTVDLAVSDCVIADSQGPLALAGIMGGKQSAASEVTSNIVVEAASYVPEVIRISSRVHHIRTEASARFEKGVDATLVTVGLQRFLALIGYSALCDIMVAGSLPAERTIRVSLQKIERILGITIHAPQMCTVLQALGFTMCAVDTDTYEITVPSFRLSDVRYAEDIAEEIARMMGYDQFPALLPQRPLLPASYGDQKVERYIKRHLAYGEGMQEVVNYPFYDEAWLKELGLKKRYTLEVRNPVSENARCLVDSLIPHLLKNIAQNVPEESELSFFELNTIWLVRGPAYTEEKSLGMLLYSRKEAVDFYTIKQKITSIAEMLRMELTWHEPDASLEEWYMPGESAFVLHKGIRIGTVGRIVPRIFSHVAEGIAYGAELDARYLVHYQPTPFVYHAVSKFQPVRWDVSILVPYAITVTALQQAIYAVDTRITQVLLKDMFEKAEWKDRRSLSFHITLVDEHHTLTSAEIDEAMQKVTEAIQKCGGELR